MTTTTTPVATTVWNGTDLLKAMSFAARWLEHHRDHLNALNVFPVPDGDTGTNMVLTMRASTEAGHKAPDSSSTADIAQALAYGALMGARGNSGVILSQLFRGFAAGLAGHDDVDGEDVARALEDASEMAYKAVMEPVEGTMLTVIRAAANASTASRESSLATVLQDSLAAARSALERTPEQLDILRQAGVVDAGGQGIVYILEGLTRYINGDTDINAVEESPDDGAATPDFDSIAGAHGEVPFGYCTNFVIFGQEMDFARARDEIAGMGQSAVIVGDDSTIKVHVHTEDPGTVLQYALTLGVLDQIKIDNMSLQAAALSEERKPASDGHVKRDSPVVDGSIGIIAVAAGEGLKHALASMGAHETVAGGQTMNPSTEDLLQAVNRLPVDDIIILPNNKNIIMAAKQVAPMTGKNIRVVPTRSVPQGLAALENFTREASLDDNASRMTAALAEVHSIEITHAVRDTTLNGISITTGDLIGLVDGKLVDSGPALPDVVTKTLSSFEAGDPELLTVFTGDEATPDATTALQEIVEQLFPDAEIEVIEGGQPHYPYVISIQ